MAIPYDKKSRTKKRYRFYTVPAEIVEKTEFRSEIADECLHHFLQTAMPNNICISIENVVFMWYNNSML